MVESGNAGDKMTQFAAKKDDDWGVRLGCHGNFDKQLYRPG